MTPFVKTETLKPGIAVITFYHPAHNSLPGDILAQLAESISEVGKDDEIRVLILKSSGDRTFCAGASFDELIAIENEEQGKNFFMGFARVINACRTCPKFIIGRVQGKAVGGGVGVAAAVDYCLASKYASVKLSELAVGIGPFVVGPAVERKIGTSAFSQLSINATEFQTAQWAKDKGLYAEVYDWPEELDRAILALAEKLSDSNPEAQRMLKKVIWEGTENWDDLLEKRAEISGKLVLSDYTKSALTKFGKK